MIQDGTYRKFIPIVEQGGEADDQTLKATVFGTSFRHTWVMLNLI